MSQAYDRCIRAAEYFDELAVVCVSSEDRADAKRNAERCRKNAVIVQAQVEEQERTFRDRVELRQKCGYQQ